MAESQCGVSVWHFKSPALQDKAVTKLHPLSCRISKPARPDDWLKRARQGVATMRLKLFNTTLVKTPLLSRGATLEHSNTQHNTSDQE
jgi:hypothetical protein